MVYARCACIIIHATPRCKTINLSMSKSILCSQTPSPSLCALRKNIVREADNKHTFSICTLRVHKNLRRDHRNVLNVGEHRTLAAKLP